MGISSDGRIKFVFIIAVHPSHMRYLDRCIGAIENQSYSNWEIYLCFDGFLPSKKYGSRVHCFSSEEQEGQVYWLNLVIRNLNRYTTHFPPKERIYINFHGADDWLFNPGVLMEVARVVKNKFLKWVYGSHYTAHQDGIKEVKSQPFNYKKLLRGNYIAGGAVFVPLETYKEVGSFREIWLSQGADWDMWLRIGEYINPVVINLPIYFESIGTSMIRPDYKKLSTKIFNRIKYPILRLCRLWK